MRVIGMYREIGTGEHLSLYGPVMIWKRYVQCYPLRPQIINIGLQIICVGSVEELEKLSGVKGITDLHRESIDHIIIPSKQGKGVLKRVEEVFDCWFESGSMPYAQQHYPFENKEVFENGFPADFVSEGIDQTRGRSYHHVCGRVLI